MKNVKKRDVSVDIARSLAIALMVSANMAVISHSEPIWAFRLTSSLAAPMFVILANMMVALGFIHGKNFLSSVIKGLFLFIVAILFDTSNFIVPLVNVDVLYLLGISVIFTGFVVRFSKLSLAAMGLAILAVTPYLQAKYGYQTTMIYSLTTENVRHIVYHILREVPHRYFVDGWFPLIPWLALGIFGAILGKMRYAGGKVHSFATKRHVIAAISLIGLGALVWRMVPGHQYILYHYIELFYPPVPGFMLFAMGIAYGTLALMDHIGDVSLFAFLHPLGEASLFMYLFHIMVITQILLPLGVITFGMRYLIYYLILLNVMIGIGYLLRRVRKYKIYKKMPHAVKWIFG